jgi:membrane-associated phospholipid phosphatase
MDALISAGIQWIVTIQSLGAWLAAPMRIFTNLGSEDFIFLVLPLIYWCIDARIGLQVAMILVTSNNLKPILKMFFAGPRPYWVSAQVKAFIGESSFGIPSGHAQDAVSLWGILASNIRTRWAWVVAGTLAFLIGFSRLYLGVHFVHDVIAGWLVGALLLWLFMKFWQPVEDWLKRKSLGSQILIAFLVSMIFITLGALDVARLAGYTLPVEWLENAQRVEPYPDPVSMESSLTAAGTFFGLAVGIAWLAARGGYQAEGPVVKRALRYVVGLIGVVILWMGLGQVFPDNADLVSFILRYARYVLVGFWVTAGAPWLFFRFKLANSRMQDALLI